MAAHRDNGIFRPKSHRGPSFHPNLHVLLQCNQSPRGPAGLSTASRYFGQDSVIGVTTRCDLDAAWRACSACLHGEGSTAVPSHFGLFPGRL
jgi:hypothetical protein